MQNTFRYNSFYKIIDSYAYAKNGLLTDTNFLISLTYELSTFHDQSIELYELISENLIGLFCNVNVRNEFLEVHRRIIITEALVSFSSDPVVKQVLPFQIKGRIKSLKTRRDNATKKSVAPSILSDTEIKMYAEELSSIYYGPNNLWNALCEKYLAHTLTAIWTSLETDFNINFLSLRKNDITNYLVKEPEWFDAIKIIEKYGIGSSDSMIINMFMCTNFLILITSDKEIARIIEHLDIDNKFVLIPNGIKL